MSALDSLCNLPPPRPSGCCGSPAPVAAFPVRPSNPPGLSAIRYRIGNFTSFRRAMLDEVARPDLLPGIPNPFGNWREGSDADYQTMFIELWAYLADILTFYQERIANEAYLPTATQLDSMRGLAALIGFRPSPGSGASGTVALTVAKGKTVVVPAGFRVGSKAKPAAGGQPAKSAAVFETAAALVAIDEHNAIPLSPVAPTNQFAKLASFGTFFGPTPVEPSVLATVATDLYGEAAPIYVSTFPKPSLLTSAPSQFSAGIGAVAAAAAAPRLAAVTSAALRTAAAPAPSQFAASQTSFGSPQFAFTGPLFDFGFGIGVDFGGLDIPGILRRPLLEPGFSYRPFTDNITRTVVFRGLNLKVKAGDQLLAVENEGGPASGDHAEVTTLHQVVSVATDKASNTTTITWVEDPKHLYDVSQSDPNVYAFRVKAGVFGNTAPEFDTLSASLTDVPPATTPPPDPNANAPLKGKNWDDPGNIWFSLPKPEESESQVLLDGIYDNATGTQQNPGWAVLLSDEASSPFIAHVVDAQPVSRAAYASTAKITRLTFFQDKEKILRGSLDPPAPNFPIRTTVVLTANEKLALQDNLPLPPQVSGDTIILSGVHKQLQAGQEVIVRGPLFPTSSLGGVTQTTAELRTIKGAPNSSAQFGITTVLLDRPLDNTYTRANSVLLANVVDVTQGETVKDEVLGNGNGREGQSFTLKKSPLTYLPSTDPNSSSAVQSTLIVTVNGVRWRELPTLLESPADDQAFTATNNSDGTTTITFGDGFHGARPPSGVNNIHARYRKGLGTSGNVDPDGVQQLVDSAAGLQKVTNPQPASGGADPDAVDDIRLGAPASVRAFNRAVSAEDYAALALSFPGVAKASSLWITRDESLRPVVHPYIQLTVAAANQLPLADQPVFAAKLRRFLDQRRDPNVSLRIVDFTPVFLDVAVTVDIGDRYPRGATLASAQAALRPSPNPGGSPGFFAFDRLQFGESIHLSAVYAALLAVPGVADANITTLRRTDQPAGANNVQTAIFIRPTEIAAIGTDPSALNQGSLTVSLGQGGFADQ